MISRFFQWIFQAFANPYQKHDVYNYSYYYMSI